MDQIDQRSGILGSLYPQSRQVSRLHGEFNPGRRLRSGALSLSYDGSRFPTGMLPDNRSTCFWPAECEAPPVFHPAGAIPPSFGTVCAADKPISSTSMHPSPLALPVALACYSSDFYPHLGSDVPRDTVLPVYWSSGYHLALRSGPLWSGVSGYQPDFPMDTVSRCHGTYSAELTAYHHRGDGSSLSRGEPWPAWEYPL